MPEVELNAQEPIPLELPVVANLPGTQIAAVLSTIWAQNKTSPREILEQDSDIRQKMQQGLDASAVRYRC